MESSAFIVGGFVVAGVTLLAISTINKEAPWSQKLLRKMQFFTDEPKNTDLPSGLANRMYDGYEDEDRISVDSANSGGRKSRKKSRKRK
jgi:hypothetical protein